MRAIVEFYNSTLGKKVIVALTGAAMVLFVIGHMTGNLKMFAGCDAGICKMDEYAHFLREMGAELFGKETLLWGARLGLIGAFLLHVVTIIQLRARNRAARPKGYAVEKRGVASLASTMMFWGGLILFAFVVVHILHFTTGHLHFEGFEHGKVYANVHKGFQVWYWVAFYLVAMGALSLHLYHGVWSMFQTLGIDNPDRNRALRGLAQVVAVIIPLGFVSVPLAIALGMMPSP